MKKDEILTKLETAGDADYIFRTLDEEETFLENHKASILESEVGAKSELYRRLDDDILNISGMKKSIPNEPTTKYLKNVLSSLKGKSELVESLQTEIESLKKGSPEVEAKLREITSLQKQMDKIRQDYESRIDQMAKDNLKNNVKSEIERGLLGLKIKPGIPDSMKQIYIDNVINDLASKAEIRDGKIVFLDAEGKALRDPATMAPFTAESLLKDRMKDVIDNGRQMQGPNLGDPVRKTPDGKINIIVPDYVTSREKLGDYLVKELGIKRTSPEFMEAYKTHGANLPAFENK